MTRQSKKDEELKILRAVFKKKRYPKYIPSERPDFIMHHKVDFGVEVTEYYPDETSARAHNMPNYVNLAHKGMIHKDDKDKVSAVLVERYDKKRLKWKKMKAAAVSQDNKSIQDRITLLFKLIETKSTDLNTYRKGLEGMDVDLIVRDTRNAMIDGINNVFMRRVMSESFTHGVFRESEFRNIYLVLPGYLKRKDEVIQLK